MSENYREEVQSCSFDFLRKGSWETDKEQFRKLSLRSACGFFCKVYLR